MKNKQIGYFGLGKMGLNMCLRLQEKGWQVIASNRSEAPRLEAKNLGIQAVDSLEQVVAALPKPRLFWIMVSHQAVDEVITKLIQLLEAGDTIIDGGNSFYKDSTRRSRDLAAKKINFLDVGTSGGPGGARHGACLMIGGDKQIFEQYQELFRDIAAPEAYGYFGASGAGHFVKMAHNGIEYGMMQAIAEGFVVLKKSDFNLDLPEIARVYNHRSVIESRLVGWLEKALAEHGSDLDGISGEVSHSGEGQWTVEAAKELGVPVEIIEKSLQFRVQSKGNPSFIGKVLSALRNQFGGHEVSQHPPSAGGGGREGVGD